MRAQIHREQMMWNSSVWVVVFCFQSYTQVFENVLQKICFWLVLSVISLNFATGYGGLLLTYWWLVSTSAVHRKAICFTEAKGFLGKIPCLWQELIYKPS